MEWIETTGRSVEEAKEAALDELGVDEVDAEFQVLTEAQTGLFGRLRTEARVRARVRPTAPRSKDDRRDRRRRSSSGASAGSSASAGSAGPAGASGGDSSSRASGSPRASGSSDDADGSASDRPASSESASSQGAKPRQRRRRGGQRSTTSSTAPAAGAAAAGAAPSGARAERVEASSEAGQSDRLEKGANVTEVAMEQQGQLAADFLSGLVAEFGLQANAAVTQPDEETVEVRLNGPDLGILIGPKGATLLALQNLARTVVFNRTGANNGHVNVDVGGYRQKRTEALARFATQVAGTVKQSGQRTALEPMSSIDRKVVHDTIASIDGVSTVSEGEEPRRRVVVLPA